MTLLSPHHNYAADECIAQIHIPSSEEKVRASETFDKNVLTAAHMAALHDAYILEMATHPVTGSPVQPVSPTSSIGDLKPVTLKQLKIGKVHRRKVLYGTLCMKTLCTVTTNGIVVVNVLEDEEGSATPICLCNALTENCGSAQAQRLYPQGCQVAVREPYLTRYPDGEVGLLVEKPTDLVFLWVPEVVGSVLQMEEANGQEEGSTPIGKDVNSFGKKEHEENCSINGNGSEQVSAEANGNGDDDYSGRLVCKEVTKEDDKVVLEDEFRGGRANRELNFEDLQSMEEKQGDDKELVGDEESAKKTELELNGDVSSIESAKETELEVNGDVGSEESTKDIEGTTNETELDVNGDVGNEGSSKETEFEVNGDVSNEESDREIGLKVNGDEGDEKSSKETDLIVKENIGKGIMEQGGGLEDVEGDILEHNMVKETTKLETKRRWESSANLRARGNSMFGKGEFKIAAELYSQAAEVARKEMAQPLEEAVALSNLAEALLRLGCNDKALKEAKAVEVLLSVAKVGGTRSAMAKCFFRKGRALMGLRRYEEAMAVLEEVLAMVPHDAQLKDVIAKCRGCLVRAPKPSKRQRAALKKRPTCPCLW